MRKKIFSMFLALALVFTYSFSMPVFAGTAKLKTIKIISGRENTGYDIKDGVKLSWKGIKGAEKYYVVKNGKRIKTIKATEKNEKYKFTESDTRYNGDMYSVCASKSVKQKQYYNKKTKKWQTKKPAKKNLGKTRNKKIQKVFATSSTLPIKYNSGSNGAEGAATNIEYYTDSSSKITGYKKFNIADTKYFDISDNEDIAVGPDFWKEFVSTGFMPNGKTLLQEWAVIGDSICRQYSGYRTYWGSWNNDYQGGGSRLNYIADMPLTKPTSWGGKSRDNSKVSGLLTATSFSEVRQKMSDQVKERIDHGALDDESSKILSNSKLTVLDDKTPRDIVYVVGTNIDENGSKYCNKYKYSSHAIIFYDFALEPIVDDNLETISDIAGYKTLEEVAAATNKVKINETDQVVYTDNDNITSTEMSRTSGTTYSNALSTTMSNSETISYGQSLTLTGGLDFKVKDFIEAKTSVAVGFTWGEAYTSAKSKGETITQSSTSEETVRVTVPPQTTLGVREQKTDLTCKYNFRTPMRVTYKVCIADLVGMVYADDVEVCNFESYDQGAFAAFFGDGGNNGEDATDSLYLRAEKNVNKATYDDYYGKVYTYRNKEERKDEGINWAQATAGAKTGIHDLIYNQPMFSNGGTISITSQATTYTVGKPIPIYKLSAVRVNQNKMNYDQEVNVAVGDSYVINNKIQLLGYNCNAITYTLFMQGNGYWVACDENGKEIPEDKNELFEITSTNILKAKKAGVGYITYRLNDTAKNTYISKEGGHTVNPGDPHGSSDVVLDSSIVPVHIS